MLEQEPTQRYSIQQVMQHSWFLMGLPPGAHVLNLQSLRQVSLTHDTAPSQGLVVYSIHLNA